MMNLTFGLFTQVSDSGPQGPLVYTSPTVHMTWCEREWPNILSTCKIKHTFYIATRDVYCSTVTGIKKCI